MTEQTRSAELSALAERVDAAIARGDETIGGSPDFLSRQFRELQANCLTLLRECRPYLASREDQRAAQADVRERIAKLLWEGAGRDSDYRDDIEGDWEWFWVNSSVARTALCKTTDAILAIPPAPAEPGEAEPVAWLYENPKEEANEYLWFRTRAPEFTKRGWTETPLYDRPQPDPARDEAIRAEATFLLDRLSDAEQYLSDDEFCRQYGGHVTPSIERLRDLLRALGPAPSAKVEENDGQ